MQTPEERYIQAHSTAQGEALEWIEKQTNIRTNYPRMLSGAVQGRFLTMMAKISGARNILEIGTFTGYSAACMAMGLTSPDGHVDTIEVNDELEDLIREGWSKAGVSDKITLWIGNAINILKELPGPFDLVFIDANKREYSEYYELMIDKIPSGGLIIADDVLWDGKPWQEPQPQDKQTQGIVAFNDKVAADTRVEVVLLTERHGLSLIRKK